MNERQNLDLLVGDSIDEAIAPDEQLADVGISNLGNEPSPVGEATERSRCIPSLANKTRSIPR